jgi:hypothetical protein
MTACTRESREVCVPPAMGASCEKSGKLHEVAEEDPANKDSRVGRGGDERRICLRPRRGLGSVLMLQPVNKQDYTECVDEYGWRRLSVSDDKKAERERERKIDQLARALRRLGSAQITGGAREGLC